MPDDEGNKSRSGRVSSDGGEGHVGGASVATGGSVWFGVSVGLQRGFHGMIICVRARVRF
jgi:hypothetical protein